MVKPLFSPGTPEALTFKPEPLCPKLCFAPLASQKGVEDLVKDGKNVFFTGNAGTGKSFLLNRIVDALRQQYGGEFQSCVAVTAATGIAATHVGGTWPPTGLSH